MASALSGQWKLIYADNVGAYCEAIGTQPAYSDMATKLLTPDNDIRQHIKFKDGEVTIITLMPGKTTDLTARYGQAVDHPFLDGRMLKVVMSLDGDSLKEEQSGAFVSSNVRYVENGQLIMKMTANGVTTTRRYKKIK